MSRLVATSVTAELSARRIVDDVSLSVGEGEVVGLLGPNGAGKSTLMRALVGQLDFKGAVEIEGRSLSQLSAVQRARLVAYLPQSRVVGWPLAVKKVVGLGRMPWDGDAAGDESVMRAMAAMDIVHLADRPATRLSGGEQARMLAARAIAQDTPVLVADEPAAGLDPAHQMTMMMALRKLAGEGRSVLVSLHDLTLAARWCDRLVVLREGRVVAEGAPADVLTAKILADVFGIVARIDSDPDGMLLTPFALAPRSP